MSDFQPIVPNLVSATQSLINKYDPNGQYQGMLGANLLSALNVLPIPAGLPIYNPLRPATTDNTIAPLALYDQTRANRGLSPLTPKQSALILQTLRSQAPATKPRRQGLLQSAVSDLRGMVGGIFHLPQNLIHEVQQLPQLPGLATQVLANASNPINAVGNLASLPGLRMVPGAFVAQELASDQGQGVQGLLAHPLFTALDLLPAAEGAARLTKAGGAAEGAYRAQVEALVAKHTAAGLDASTTILPRPPRALKTALTQSLTSEGTLVPNRLGRGIGALAEDLRGTSFGSAFTKTFRERATSRITEEHNAALQEAQNPAIPTESLRFNVPGGNATVAEELYRRDLATSISKSLEAEGIDPLSPRAAMLFDRATLSRLPDGTPLLPEQMPDLTTGEQAILRNAREFQYQQRIYTDMQPGTASTRTLNIDGTPETYDYHTARKISKAKAIDSSAQEILQARTTILDPASATAHSPETIQGLLDAIPQRLAAGELTKRGARTLTDLYTEALAATTRSDPQAILGLLRAIAREYPTIPRLIDHIQKGRWAQANSDIRSLASTRHGRALPVDLAGYQETLTSLIKRDRVLSRTSHIDERYTARAARNLVKTEARNPAPRFDPLIQAESRARTISRVKEVFADNPNLDKMVRLADEGIYDTISTVDPRFERWVREDQIAVRGSWKALRDAGHDPIFFSRVTPEQAARQPFIRISDHPETLQAVRKRMMDATPAVKDIGIVVTQQALDLLSRRSTEFALDRIGSTYGRTRASLVAEFSDRLLNNPDARTPLATRLAHRIDQGWVKYNPGEFGGKPLGVFSVEKADQIYIPRAMHENLRAMYEPKPSRLTAIFDRPMNAFRTSVLPLAVRWQLNNGISNAVISAVEDPRALLEIPRVIEQMWGERKLMPAAEERMRPIGMPPAGIGSMSPDMMRWAREAKHGDRVSAVAQWASGNKLHDLYNTARESRIAKLTDGFKKGVEKSYGANQFVDDIFRASMGRAKMKRYLGEGYSEAAAQALTTSSIRRVFQAWDEMTPMERSVMRSVVPFYGFSAYALRYVLHYPFDHPLRVSVLNSFTRAELNDHLTGLPQYIREMILLGDPKANGVVKALNVAPFNPFGGVASMFTVAGFLGQLNPIITGALESMGINVQRGGPQLYPELRYDPESGRLVANPGGNLASNIAGNLIPQLSGVTSLLGWNDQFNETLARDPAAAGRMLLSNFGLPVLYRDVNIGDQLIKAELARQQDQETARKQALKTGNLGILDDFPGLAAYGEQVRALQKAGLLDQLRPQQGQPGTSSGAGLLDALAAAG